MINRKNEEKSEVKKIILSLRGAQPELKFYSQTNRNRDMLMPLSNKFHFYFRYHRMMIMRIKRAQREIKNQKMLE